MHSHRGSSGRIVTRGRVAALIVATLAIAGATVFVVSGRADLHAAHRGLQGSQHHIAQLDVAQRDAVDARTRAFAALAHEQDVLRNDTASHNRLIATDRSEYRLLSAALKTLSQHRAQLAAGATHAALLNECLAGASQVLNEASVGDTFHLASTLPPVQQVCTEAAA